MSTQALDEKLFEQRGLLHLRGYLPAKAVAAAKNTVDSELKRAKMIVNGKVSTAKLKDVPIFQQVGVVGQAVRMGPELAALFPDELVKAMATLAKGGLKKMHPQPQLLLSLPHKEEWSLRSLNWHLDLKPPPARDLVPGVQAFVLIDDVLPRGGATLALAGSHKLHYVLRDQNAHGVLKQTPAFEATPEKFLEPQVLHGIETQIVEMSGKAGDVYLMDLRVLHTPSINATKKIRMMATNRFVK